MLNKLYIRNFKLFDEVEIDLGERVVFIGPNNSGKTTALQAIALWDVGVKKWIEKRGAGIPSRKRRAGVTINRRDLIGLPTPSAILLWKDLHVRKSFRLEGKQKTRNVVINIAIEGIGGEGKTWKAALEYDYANEESFYCRPMKGESSDDWLPVPEEAGKVEIAYLPPMSGLAANEDKLDPGALNVRIGEGRTAEVLRNLCFLVLTSEDGERKWDNIVHQMNSLFRVTVDKPIYIPERGAITMTYRDTSGVKLDISNSGRGLQQTLLLLAHMSLHPGSVLLLDEPDAHLEILRQREIYNILSDMSEQTNSQIIAASHSEVILNEAADRDVLVAFVGKPHRIDDRSSQVAKALKSIGFEHYLMAEEQRWVLFLEGSTDLAILRAFANLLDHPASEALEKVYAHYIGNSAQKAREHFYGLKEAVPTLQGYLLLDSTDNYTPHENNDLLEHVWEKNEIENYLCNENALIAYAENEARNIIGELSAHLGRDAMLKAINDVEKALAKLGKPSPWDGRLKVSDDFLEPLFRSFFAELDLPNRMSKSDYHVLVKFVPVSEVDAEVKAVLDEIYEIHSSAQSKK